MSLSRDDQERLRRMQDDIRRNQLAEVIRIQQAQFQQEQGLTGPAATITDPDTGTWRKALAASSIIGQPAIPMATKIQGDLALGAMTGTAGLVAGGVAAAPVAPFNNDKAMQILTKVQDAISVTPFSRNTEELIGAAQPGFEAVKNKMQDIIFAVSGGNPEVAAVAQTTLEGVATIMGLRRGKASRAAINAAKADLERVAKDMGINLDAPNLNQEFMNAAEGMTGARRGDMIEGNPTQKTELGHDIPELQTTLRKLKAYERSRVKWAYDIARAKDGQVYARSMQELMTRIDEQINERGFDIVASPKANSRLRDLEGLVQRDSAAQLKLHSTTDVDPEMRISQGVSPLAKDRMVSLNTIDDIRKRLVTNPDDPEFALHKMIRDEIDDWTMKQYDAGMFRGDKDAGLAFENARAMHRRYATLFKDQRFIRNLVEMEATPGMLRNWIYGASGVNEQKAIVVRRLGDILGTDSPQFDAIRKDFLFDIVRPLTRREPNFAEFLQKVETLQDKAPGIVDELDLVAGTQLKELTAFVRAADKAKLSPEFNVDLDRMVTRLIAGNSLARNAAKMNLLYNTIKYMRGSGPQARAQIEREILGPDVDKPFMPPGSVGQQAFIAWALSDKEEDDE